MKTPKFFSKLSAVLTPRPKKKLQATAARSARRSADDYDEEEPTTNLSSAFVVVLILHVVAVGGIYAFNSIKQSRKGHEPIVAPIEQTAPAPQKSLAQNDAPAAASTAARPVAPAAHPAETAPAPAAAPARPATGHQYQVKAGDTLTKVAFAYGVTPAEIMEANHLKEGAVLHQGQTLTIPAGKTADKTADALGKAGDKVGDTAVTTRVKAGFSKEPLLKETAIDVQTADGVVTLRGSVGSDAARARAAAIASATDGVTRVVNMLVVQGA